MIFFHYSSIFGTRNKEKYHGNTGQSKKYPHPNCASNNCNLIQLIITWKCEYNCRNKTSHIHSNEGKLAIPLLSHWSKRLSNIAKNKQIIFISLKYIANYLQSLFQLF